MSFADFLHFLVRSGDAGLRGCGKMDGLTMRALYWIGQEEHRQEYKHMPEIITRVSELGAVMESQKRHIDRWKVQSTDDVG